MGGGLKEKLYYLEGWDFFRRVEHHFFCHQGVKPPSDHIALDHLSILSDKIYRFT